MKKKNLPLSQVYTLIEPGPVLLVTTAHKEKFNVMTLSWHMMIEFVPPLIGCILSDRNASFDLLKKSKECVLNIPTLHHMGRGKFMVAGRTIQTKSKMRV